MTGSARAADLVIEGAIVITMDAERRIFREGAVVIGDGRILAVGRSPEIGPAFQAGRRISGKGTVVIPGLVNAHSHFLPFVRGAVPEAHPADAVRRGYLYPFFRDLSEEEEVTGAKLRMWEMIRGGTTCFADGGCKHLEAVARAVEEMGLRGVLGRWRCDLTERGAPVKRAGGVKAGTERALEQLEEELRGRTGSSGRVRTAATLVDDRVTSESLLRGAFELAERYDTTLSLDVAITRRAVKEAVRRRGLRPVQWMKRIGALGGRVVLNHATDLDPRDVEVIAETGARVCWTPSAALRRGHGISQTGMIPELLASGAAVALGTDGPASSDYADMVRVMYLAATLPVDARISHGVSSSEAALEMGTLHGARALGRADEIGSLEAGKRADLVVLDVERPEWRPLFHPVNNLVYAASGDSVKTVIVDGRVILDEGRLAVEDEKTLLEAGRTLRTKMRERLARYSL